LIGGRNWVVYLLRCADRSLYCGVTNPVALVGICEGMTRSGALQLEHRIKKLPAKRKWKQLENGKEIVRMATHAKITKDIKSIAAGIQKVASKIEAIAASLGSGEQPADQAGAPKKPAKRAPKKKTSPSKKAAKVNTDTESVPQTVLELIKKAPDGISNADLLEASGFDKRKLNNATFRLKKAGLVKSAKRGVYQAV
jgi:predicted GIY-YIG superfamily endonuclease